MFNAKKSFFKKKLVDCQKVIWELEFKIAKSRQLREGIRQDREFAVENVAQIEARLKQKDISKEEKEQLETSLAIHKDNVQRYERQITMVDNEINGIPANGEDPGQEGIKDRIAGYAELREMYKSYLKTL